MADSMKNIAALLLLFTGTISVTYGRPAADAVSCALTPYNTTYPITPPVKANGVTKFRIAVVSDLDRNSKKEDKLVSYLKRGYLTYDGKKKVTIEWDKGSPVELSADNSVGGRGMELSELVTFNGNLFSMDDKTGIIYQLDEQAKKIYTFAILSDGDGKTSKGLKGEWATVKDRLLYVGSHGREQLTKDGKIQNYDMQWVKTISTTGEVKSVDWRHNFNQMRHMAGADFPGYLTHESGVWSTVHKRWFFLPRKLSKEMFNPKTDESKATNILLSCDEKFSDVTITHVGPLAPTHGFASFKFIPGSGDTVILALKSEEVGDKTASFVMVFTISGEMLVPETEFVKDKYEGIEFI